MSAEVVRLVVVFERRHRYVFPRIYLAAGGPKISDPGPGPAMTITISVSVPQPSALKAGLAGEVGG